MPRFNHPSRTARKSCGLRASAPSPQRARAAAVSLALALLLALMAFPVPAQPAAQAFAAEASGSPCSPTVEQLSAYEADGTLDERQAFQDALGHDSPDEALVAQAVAREQQAEGDAAAQSVPPAWQGGMPTEGEARILLLRVSFPAEGDEPAARFSDGDSLEALEALVDGDGTFPYESLSAYYERSSYGKLKISGEAFDYEAQHARSYYEANVDDLFVEALAALDAQIDYADFDGNGDGYLDGVYLRFAGGGAGWGTTWWSNAWTNVSGTSFDGVALSKLVTLHLPSDDSAAARTIIHETGHVLGLPDYYSYRAQQGGASGRSGILTFDMMMDNVGDHNGFSKWLLGWLDDDDVTRVVATSAGITVTRGGNVVATAQPDEEGVSSIEQELAAFTSDEASETGGIIVVSNQDEGPFFSYYLLQYDRCAGNQSIGYVNAASPDTTSPLPSGFRLFRVQAQLVENGSDFAYSNAYGTVNDQLIELVDPDMDADHVSVDGAAANAEADGYGCMLYEGDEVTPDTYPSTNFFENKGVGYTGIGIRIASCGPGSGTVEISHTGADEPDLPDFSLSLREGQLLYNMGEISFDASSAPRLADGGTTRSFLVVDGVRHPATVRVDGSTVSIACYFDANEIAPDSTCEALFGAGQFIVAETADGEVVSPEIRIAIPVGDVAHIASAGSYADTASSDGSKLASNVCELDDGRLAFFSVKDGRIALSLVSPEGTEAETLALSGDAPERIPAQAALEAVSLGGGSALLVVANADLSRDLYAVDASTGAATALEPIGSAGSVELEPCGDGSVLALFPARGDFFVAALIDSTGADATRYASFAADAAFATGGGNVASVSYRYEGDAGSTVSIASAEQLASLVRERGVGTLQEVYDGAADLGSLPAESTLSCPGRLNVVDVDESAAGFAVLSTARAGDPDEFGAAAVEPESAALAFSADGTPLAQTTVASSQPGEAWSVLFQEASISDNGAIAVTRREQPRPSGLVLSETVLIAPANAEEGAATASRVLAYANGEGAWLANDGWLSVGWDVDPFPDAAGSPASADGAAPAAAAVNDAVYRITAPIGGGAPSDPAAPSNGNGLPQTGDAAVTAIAACAAVAVGAGVVALAVRLRLRRR